MTIVLNKLHQINNKLQIGFQNFSNSHPIISFIAVFIGAPVFILCSIALITTAVALPMCYFCGKL